MILSINVIHDLFHNKYLYVYCLYFMRKICQGVLTSINFKMFMCMLILPFRRHFSTIRPTDLSCHCDTKCLQYVQCMICPSYVLTKKVRLAPRTSCPRYKSSLIRIVFGQICPLILGRNCQWFEAVMKSFWYPFGRIVINLFIHCWNNSFCDYYLPFTKSDYLRVGHGWVITPIVYMGCNYLSMS